MELSTLWFILIGVLFTGFFVLEGFDYGVGILMPWLGKTEAERRTILKSIGPLWDGNEVWLLTAAGAIFAAFPKWYATLFSSLYLPFLLLLVSLILRGLALEYRNKLPSRNWRSRWDVAIFFGSFFPAFLIGVAITDLLYGIPFDAQGTYQGTLLDLLQPFPLFAGLASLAVFTWIGLLFLQLKMQGELLQRIATASHKLKWPVLILFGWMGLFGFFTTPALAQTALIFKITALLAFCALLLSVLLVRKSPGKAFSMAVLAILLTSLSAWGSLFPHTMISSLNQEWSLTIRNASSTPYTLKIMSMVAAIFVPIVLAYQAWSYWIFRKRIRPEEQGGY